MYATPLFPATLAPLRTVADLVTRVVPDDAGSM
jgi:hypothetical protein